MNPSKKLGGRLVVLTAVLLVGYKAIETLFFENKSISLGTWIALGMMISLSVLAFVYFEWIFGGSRENKIMKTVGGVLFFGTGSLFLLLDLISKGSFF